MPVRLRGTLLTVSCAEISIVAVYGLYCLLAGLVLMRLPVPYLWVIALPLALLGLGWQITFILMPANSDLDAVERGAVAGVLSIGVGGGCALLLARTGLGLQTENLLALLVSLSGFFAVLGLLRQPASLAPDVRDEQIAVDSPVSGTTLSEPTGGAIVSAHRVFQGLAWILLSGVLAGSWFLLSLVQRQPAADPPFTELYLLDSRGYLAEDPVERLADGQILLRYGIGNREQSAAGYRICVANGTADMVCGEQMWLEAGHDREGMLVLDGEPCGRPVVTGVYWPTNRFVTMQERSVVECSVDILLLRNEELCRTLRLWISRQKAV